MNQTCQSIIGGSLEITSTVPLRIILKVKCNGKNHNIEVKFEIFDLDERLRDLQNTNLFYN